MTTPLKNSLGLLLALCLVSWQTSAQKPDRSKPPDAGPIPSFTLPSSQHFTLSNGLPVTVWEKHQVPLVQANLIVRAGSVMDPEGKTGLANLVAALMMDGAGSRDALALADAIDYLGASISSTAGQHEMAVRLNTPTAKLDSALALFADVALRPMFAPQELARKTKERLTTLLQWRDEPRVLSTITFSDALYGKSHPYGVSAIGNERSIKSFTPDDCKSFHGRWFHPNNAALVVVGDISVQALREKLERALGAWKAGSATPPALPEISQVKSSRIVLVDKPGAAQTEIRIGRIGVPRLTEDYYALVVLNTILGGSFTSRLNNNLREQHGYTYGAGSNFDFRHLSGPFFAAAGVQTAVTDKALGEFMKELKAIREPVTDEELVRAKNLLALSYPSGFQRIGEIAGQLEEVVMFNLPDTYLSTYVQRILAVTKDDVMRVARKYIDPSSLAIVLVGDRSVIEEPVKALGLGPIAVKSIDDVMGKAPVIEGTKK